LIVHEIILEKKVLAKNDEVAARNRETLRGARIFSINLVSGPGAGKTTIIEKSAPYLKAAIGTPVVIEGDIETDLDAMRLSKYEIPAKQITTGKTCHLDALMVEKALPWVLSQDAPRLLIIENVGNMVCPAEYDLGEEMLAAVLSTPEGDDKPLKYPAIFSKADVLIINKTDLTAHTNFNIDSARANALKINPGLKIFETSCYTGAGIEEWAAFLSSMALNAGI
jgi:hydrogenase nickel incorporation protein HypB